MYSYFPTLPNIDILIANTVLKYFDINPSYFSATWLWCTMKMWWTTWNTWLLPVKWLDLNRPIGLKGERVRVVQLPSSYSLEWVWKGYMTVSLFPYSSYPYTHQAVYSVSQKKIPRTVFWNFFPNGWEFLIIFLHTYYTIISTLEYKFLFKYLQLWESYAILSATT